MICKTSDRVRVRQGTAIAHAGRTRPGCSKLRTVRAVADDGPRDVDRSIAEARVDLRKLEHAFLPVFQPSRKYQAKRAGGGPAHSRRNPDAVRQIVNVTGAMRQA